MAKELPKSGKVTIKLGPREVRELLADPMYGVRIRWGRSGLTIAQKLSKAVAERFSNVQVVMDEVQKARDISHNMRASDEWKELEVGFTARSDALYGQVHELDGEQAQAMEKLIQKAFDKAGITRYKACNFGFVRITDGKEEWEL